MSGVLGINGTQNRVVGSLQIFHVPSGEDNAAFRGENRGSCADPWQLDVSIDPMDLPFGADDPVRFKSDASPIAGRSPRGVRVLA
jgi:hypothetical protein